MDQVSRLLLKSRPEAFKSGDRELYKKARYNFRKAVMDVKKNYKTEQIRVLD